MVSLGQSFVPHELRSFTLAGGRGAEGAVREGAAGAVSGSAGAGPRPWSQLSADGGRLPPQLTNEKLESQKQGELPRVTDKPATGLCEDPGLLPSRPWIYLLKSLPQAWGPNKTKSSSRGHATWVRLHTLLLTRSGQGPILSLKQRRIYASTNLSCLVGFHSSD